MKRIAILIPVFVLALASAAPAQITLKRLGTYATGLYEQVAAEIGAHDPASQRAFVTNSATNTVDAINMQDPRSLSLAFKIPLADYGASPTSVAFKNGLGAVAVISEPKTDPGRVVFFTNGGAVLGSVVVGSLPDALAFSADGKKLLVANEGEPSDDYTVDPEGSISIIDVGAVPTQAQVRTVGFASLNGQKHQLQERGVRFYGPKIELVPGPSGEPEPVVTEGGASVAQDLEPEFIAISRDSKTAWVTLQENNAIAIVDIQRARLRKIVPLGYKLLALRHNALDASDRDGGTNIKPWPVRGMYLPDGVAAFEADGHSYLITANEGDTRDWEGFSEEARVGGLTLGGPLSHLTDLQANKNLGRLKVTNSPPNGKDAGAGPDGEDVYRKLYSFGGRSFSIWSDEGELVFDSGDDLERQTARLLGVDFNSDNASSPSGDSRSDDKGPEPEGVAVGKVGGKTYAFICLERPGGVMIYDI